MTTGFLKRIMTVILMVGTGMLIGCKDKDHTSDHSQTPTPTPTATQSSSPKTGSPESAQGLPRLLDLGATQCVPCKMMKPILEELKKEYKGRMQVDFIDVWENQDEGKLYGIESIPTQIFFDDSGKELFRHVGFFSKEEILGKWKELGITFDKGVKK